MAIVMTWFYLFLNCKVVAKSVGYNAVIVRRVTNGRPNFLNFLIRRSFILFG